MTWSPRPRKTVRGVTVTSLSDLIDIIDRHEWLYVRGKVTHPSVAANFSLVMVRSWIGCGWIERAMRADDVTKAYVSQPKAVEDWI